MYHERQQLQRCLLHTVNNLLQQQAWTVQSLNELCDSIQAQRTRWLGNYDANVLAAALERYGLEVTWHDARDTQLDQLDLSTTGGHLDLSACSELHIPSELHISSELHIPNEALLHADPVDKDLGSHSEPHQRCQQVLTQQAEAQEQAEAAAGCGQHKQQHQHQQQSPPQQQEQQEQREQQEQAQQQQEQQQQLVGLVLNVAGQGWLSALLGGRHWLAIRWLQGAWWNLDSKLPAPVCFAEAAAAAVTPDAAAGGATGDKPTVTPLRSQAVPQNSHSAVTAAAAATPAAAAAAAPAAAGVNHDGGAAALKAFLQQQLRDGAHLLLVTRSR